MRNIKLTIEYDGTDYNGWQIQKKGSKLKTKTIQGTIEEALGKILQEKVRLIAAGRTDSGVHAEAQVANFKTNSRLSSEEIRRALNACLPHDILILKAEEVDIGFHARYSARAKSYRYTILNSPNPSVFWRKYVHFIPYPLNVNSMRKEARCLLGRHNFKSFQAQDRRMRTCIRTIKELSISKQGDFIHIHIQADGFLYNMVRNIVGTLIEIGRGRLAPGTLKRILLSKDRKRAGPTAPAKGLCLGKVIY